MIELLILLGLIGFIQNMLFTWVSRSRNSGDPDYHRYAAYCSNFVWFICNVIIWKAVWEAIDSGEYYYLIAALIIYTVATSEGSVYMMKRLLKSESGIKRVGAKGKLDYHKHQ